MPQRGITLSLYPEFADGENLSDTLYKLALQAWPYRAQVSEVRLWRSREFARRPLAEVLHLPAYLDPACAEALADLLPRIVERTQPASFDDVALRDNEGDYVLVWDEAAGTAGRAAMPALDALYHAGKTRYIDRNTCPGDAGSLQYLFYTTDPEAPAQQAESRERFIAATTRCWRRRQDAYLFAPGPSLMDGIAGLDFRDGVRIVCNSLVTSPSLMARLQPDFICVADDYLHAGAILYAGAFRKALREAMTSTSATLICRAAHQRLFEFFMPDSAKDRIVGVACDAQLPSPNFDLVADMRIHDTGNILTMFMLPLATTFSRDIHVFGFDGRAPAEQQRVWAYAAEFPIEKLRSSLDAAHPVHRSFSGAEYADRHEENVAKMCEVIERLGRRVHAVTSSHIPAFRDRFAPRRVSWWRRFYGVFKGGFA